MKIFKILLFILTFSAFTSYLDIEKKAYAHPMDNTDLYLYYEKELDGEPISNNQMSGYLYMNWFQAATLVQEEENTDAFELNMEDLVLYDDIYNDYTKDHLILTNNGEICESTFSNIPQDLDLSPLGLGKRIVMTFTCSEPLNNLKLENKLFLSEFEYATNFVNLFKGDLYVEKIETNKNFNEINMTIDENGNANVEKPENFISLDSDLSPFDPEYGKESFDDSNSIMKTSNSEGVFASITSFFNQFKSIGNLSEMNPLFILFVLFILGLLHTLEAGHSKVILSSAMISKNMDIKGGFMYALVFTATHIGDLILMGLALLIINNFIDVYEKFSMLERFAAYALLFIALYLLFKSISEYINSKLSKNTSNLGHAHNHDHHHSHDHHHHHHDGHSHSHDFDPNKSIKDQLIVGFLSGLAPCIFGWSILMVLVSSKNIWLIVPGIFAFSLGIFLALVLVVLLVGNLKKSILNRFNWFIDLSSIISALILIIYAVYIIL